MSNENDGSSNGSNSTTSIEVFVSNPKTVKIGDLEVSREKAIQLGYLDPEQEAQRPRYNITTQPQQGPEQIGNTGQHEATAADQHSFFDTEGETFYQGVTSEMPEPLQQRAIETIISNGIDSLDIRAAEAYGIDAYEYRNMATALAAAFQGQAQGYVQSRGINAEDFFAWAKENQPRELADAVPLTTHPQAQLRAAGRVRTAGNDTMPSVRAA